MSELTIKVTTRELLSWALREVVGVTARDVVIDGVTINFLQTGQSHRRGEAHS